MKKKPVKLISEKELTVVAEKFRVLSEPMRLRLLNSLRAGERTVSTLVVATGASQANASKHLGILLEAGMVARRKQGLHVFYYICDETVFKLCELMCARSGG